MDAKNVSGDILVYVKALEDGSYCIISTGANSTNTPATYCTGYAIARPGNDKVIVLYDVQTGITYTNASSGGVWRGWKQCLTSSDLYAQNLVDDLNNVKAPGDYVQTANANATTARHYPTERAGFLEVSANVDTNWVMQRYTVYDTGAMYTRCLYDKTWYVWKAI